MVVIAVVTLSKNTHFANIFLFPLFRLTDKYIDINLYVYIEKCHLYQISGLCILQPWKYCGKEYKNVDSVINLYINHKELNRMFLPSCVFIIKIMPIICVQFFIDEFLPGFV